MAAPEITRRLRLVWLGALTNRCSNYRSKPDRLRLHRSKHHRIKLLSPRQQQSTMDSLKGSSWESIHIRIFSLNAIATMSPFPLDSRNQPSAPQYRSISLRQSTSATIRLNLKERSPTSTPPLRIQPKHRKSRRSSTSSWVTALQRERSEGRSCSENSRPDRRVRTRAH